MYDYETISLFHKTQICVYTYPNEQLPQVLNEIIDKMSQTQIRICWKQKLGNLSPQHKKFLIHLLGKTEKKENIKVQMFVNMNIFERNNRTWCQLMNTRKQWLNHYKKWNIQPIQDKFEDCLFTLKFEPPKSRSQKDPKKIKPFIIYIFVHLSMVLQKKININFCQDGLVLKQQKGLHKFIPIGFALHDNVQHRLNVLNKWMIFKF